MSKLDKYDKILEEMGYGIKNNTTEIEEEVESDEAVETDKDSLTKLLEDIGIQTDKTHNLVLWNDDVNDMLHVALALFEICELNNEKALKIMMEAHLKGKAVAKSGAEDEMLKMKQGLNDRGIEATVEK